MAPAPEPSTSSSLLARLRNGSADQDAWNLFVERYGRLVYRWCRGRQLQEADAEDVTQNVLTVLASRLKTFAYDPALGFRNWLRVVTRHAWQAFLEGRQRSPGGTGDSGVLKLLESVEAREDLVQRLQEQYDHELLEIAMERVRRRVEPTTWEAFRLTAVEHRPAPEAAAVLGLKAPTVLVYRGRVQKMLRDELRQLEDGGGLA